MTSNPKSKSKPRIKEHEHQTYRKKKNMNITKSKSMNITATCPSRPSSSTPSASPPKPPSCPRSSSIALARWHGSPTPPSWSWLCHSSSRWTMINNSSKLSSKMPTSSAPLPLPSECDRERPFCFFLFQLGFLKSFRLFLKTKIGREFLI